MLLSPEASAPFITCRSFASEVHVYGLAASRNDQCIVRPAWLCDVLYAPEYCRATGLGFLQAATQAALSDMLAGLKRGGRKQLTILLLGTAEIRHQTLSPAIVRSGVEKALRRH